MVIVGVDFFPKRGRVRFCHPLFLHPFRFPFSLTFFPRTSPKIHLRSPGSAVSGPGPSVSH